MFGRLAHLMYRRRWLVVGIWIVILLVTGAFASRVGSVLGPGDFTLSGSSSWQASQILDRKFHQDVMNVTIVVMQNPAATIADRRFTSTVSRFAQRIRADRALRVQYLDNPLVSGDRQLISKDGHSVALLFSSELPEPTIESQIDPLRSWLKSPGIRFYVTGTPALNHDYAVASENDLMKGDAITVPILIIVLLLVFGTLVASALPLLLAVFSIALSLALVFVFAHMVSASVYVENVVEVLGLGVSIDYSLFIVYRFREELRRTGGDVENAVARTMETTGRAVFFSGLTVAIGLASLILTGLSFMVSMGLGGMLVPLCALAVTMTLLPAVLGLLGTRINHFRLVPVRFLSTGGGGFWRRTASTIMRYPIVTGGAALVVLLALASPTHNMKLAYGGLKNAPNDIQSVAGYKVMQERFPTTPDPTTVLVQTSGSQTVLSPRALAGMRQIERVLRENSEATKVIGPSDSLPASGPPPTAAVRELVGRSISPDLHDAIISVVPRNEVGTSANERMVRAIRSQTSGFAHLLPSGTQIYVGGASAGYIDFNDAMYSKFPLIIALVLTMTAVFLFFAFRSVILPLKAVLLNLLSVGAAYGVLQLVFQRGIGHQLLAFYPEDGVAPWVPIFLFAFLFGLSMDYEVFLISRIREAWLATRNNRASVSFGLERTGKLITSAAAIMVIAFSGFQVGHEIQLREFGFGLVASIAVDATLIRIVLVPSIMELLGDWNWWVPARLRAWSARGGEPEDIAPAREGQGVEIGAG